MLPTFVLVWYHDVTVNSGFLETSYSAMHRSLGVTKDQGAQTKTKVKRLRIEH